MVLIEPIMPLTSPTLAMPPEPANQAGAHAPSPPCGAAANVCLMSRSISSLRPSATAQTVSSSGVVIQGNRPLVFWTARSIVSEDAISWRKVLR